MAKICLVRKMHELDGCKGSILCTVLSELRPPLPFPRGSWQTHSTQETLVRLYSFLWHHPVASTRHPLWTHQTFQLLRIRTQDCEVDRLTEAMQSRSQTPSSHTFILCYLPPWSHRSGSLAQLVQMPETLSAALLWCQNSLNAAWELAPCRSGTLQDCQWAWFGFVVPQRCWFSQNQQSGYICTLC